MHELPDDDLNDQDIKELYYKRLGFFIHVRMCKHKALHYIHATAY